MIKEFLPFIAFGNNISSCASSLASHINLELTHEDLTACRQRGGSNFGLFCVYAQNLFIYFHLDMLFADAEITEFSLLRSGEGKKREIE